MCLRPSLRLLGRRVDGVRAPVLATYRDDELDRAHPLRVVLRELSTGRGIERLDLAPLSPGAVAELAEPYGVDPAELFRSSGGNPFFVTEVLGAGTKEIPPTVRDAVLARAARLSSEARNLLEALTVAPPEAPLGVLEAIAGDALESLDECLGSGMVIADAGGVAFRHELARLVIAESLAPTRRVALHARALRALADSPTGGSDPARLAHHAEAAGEGDAVLRFAPQAAKRASALGAHRESAAQYGRALRFAEALAPERRAELLERRAHECMVTDQTDEAIDALRSAIALRRGLSDVRAEGEGLQQLADVLWCPGRVAEARQAAQQAVAVLEDRFVQSTSPPRGCLRTRATPSWRAWRTRRWLGTQTASSSSLRMQFPPSISRECCVRPNAQLEGTDDRWRPSQMWFGWESAQSDPGVEPTEP